MQAKRSIEALACPFCGGPVPKGATGHVACEYCGQTFVVEDLTANAAAKAGTKGGTDDVELMERLLALAEARNRTLDRGRGCSSKIRYSIGTVLIMAFASLLYDGDPDVVADALMMLFGASLFPCWYNRLRGFGIPHAPVLVPLAIFLGVAFVVGS